MKTIHEDLEYIKKAINFLNDKGSFEEGCIESVCNYVMNSLNIIDDLSVSYSYYVTFINGLGDRKSTVFESDLKTNKEVFEYFNNILGVRALNVNMYEDVVCDYNPSK